MADTKHSENDHSNDSAPAGRKSHATPVAVGGDSWVDRLLPHVKKIAIAAGVCAALIGAFFLWAWWKDRGARKSTAAISQAFEIIRQNVDKPKPESAGTNPGATPAAKPKAEPTFDSVKARADAALAALSKSKSGVGGTATRLVEARLLFDSDKLDQAEAIYRSISSGSSQDAIVAREGLGYVAEKRAMAITDAAAQQSKLEAALTAFRAMQPDDKGMMRDHALYHEARILTLLGKFAEARAVLQKALQLVPESDIENDIEQRLAQLDAVP